MKAVPMVGRKTVIFLDMCVETFEVVTELSIARLLGLDNIYIC